MRSEGPTEPARALWQSQPVSGRQFSTEEIRHMYERFHRQIRARNAREYIAAALVVAACGWLAWRAPRWDAQLGHGLLIAGVLYVVQQLRTRGGARAWSASARTESCLAHHRRELERQRQLLLGVWRWYLGPLVPGMAVLFLSGALRAAEGGGARVLRVALSASLTAAVFIGVAKLNRRAAKQLEAQLRELEAQE